MIHVQQHASANVNRILIANKCDVPEGDRAVTTEQGRALAEEYDIKFFETSAKDDVNVSEAFRSIAVDVQTRLANMPDDRPSRNNTVKLTSDTATYSEGCCS